MAILLTVRDTFNHYPSHLPGGGFTENWPALSRRKAYPQRLWQRGSQFMICTKHREYRSIGVRRSWPITYPFQRSVSVVSVRLLGQMIGSNSHNQTGLASRLQDLNWSTAIVVVPPADLSSSLTIRTWQAAPSSDASVYNHSLRLSSERLVRGRMV